MYKLLLRVNYICCAIKKKNCRSALYTQELFQIAVKKELFKIPLKVFEKKPEQRALLLTTNVCSTTAASLPAAPSRATAAA